MRDVSVDASRFGDLTGNTANTPSDRLRVDVTYDSVDEVNEPDSSQARRDEPASELSDRDLRIYSHRRSNPPPFER